MKLPACCCIQRWPHELQLLNWLGPARLAGAAARQGTAADDSSDEEPEEVQFTDMPLEVLGVILRSLDLVSLATATAVSK